MLIRDEFCEVRVTYITVFIKKNGRLKVGVDFNSALGSINTTDLVSMSVAPL